MRGSACRGGVAVEKQKALTKWKVDTRETAGRFFYQVYRTVYTMSPDGSLTQDGCPIEIETLGGYYENRLDAERLAATLNAEEKRH